jgi:hypothetical protein
LFKTFSAEKLDEATQLKIERFLMNQAQILIEKSLANNRTDNTISNSKEVKSIFVTNKIDSKLVKQMIESESDFIKLITNYKTNIKEVV